MHSTGFWLACWVSASCPPLPIVQRVRSAALAVAKASRFVVLRNTQESAQQVSVARDCSVSYRSREIGNCVADFVGAVLLDEVNSLDRDSEQRSVTG
jgi:hypothetical protein